MNNMTPDQEIARLESSNDPRFKNSTYVNYINAYYLLHNCFCEVRGETLVVFPKGRKPMTFLLTDVKSHVSYDPEIGAEILKRYREADSEVDTATKKKRSNAKQSKASSDSSSDVSQP